MDFKGQQLSEQIFTALLTVFGAVAFVIGYWRGNFALMMAIFASGLAISMLACIPDWPAYNRHPIHWLPGSSLKAQKKTRDNKKPKASLSNLWNLF